MKSNTIIVKTNSRYPNITDLLIDYPHERERYCGVSTIEGRETLCLSFSSKAGGSNLFKKIKIIFSFKNKDFKIFLKSENGLFLLNNFEIVSSLLKLKNVFHSSEAYNKICDIFLPILNKYSAHFLGKTFSSVNESILYSRYPEIALLKVSDDKELANLHISSFNSIKRQITKKIRMSLLEEGGIARFFGAARAKFLMGYIEDERFSTVARMRYLEFLIRYHKYLNDNDFRAYSVFSSPMGNINSNGLKRLSWGRPEASLLDHYQPGYSIEYTLDVSAARLLIK